MIDKGSRRFRLALTLGILGAGSVALVYLLRGVDGPSASYLLPRRSGRLAAIALSGTCLSVSALAFQALCANRLITPSIMGVDALYILIQTSSIFFLGSAWQGARDKPLNFAVSMVVLGTFSYLCRFLFTRISVREAERGSLQLLLLAGVAASGFFAGCASWLQMLIDPNEFGSLQTAIIASFNNMAVSVVPTAVAMAAVPLWLLASRFRILDLMALGRSQAHILGIDWEKNGATVFVASSLLTGIATALTGPIIFFGLISATLVRQLGGTHRHDRLIPLAIVWSFVLLAGGQLVVEELLNMAATLPTVINLCGGLLILKHLLSEGRRHA